MKKYFNYQNGIAFGFNYRTEKEKADIMEGLLFQCLTFIGDYNMIEEFIEDTKDNCDFWVGYDFDIWDCSNTSDEELEEQLRKM